MATSPQPRPNSPQASNEVLAHIGSGHLGTPFDTTRRIANAQRSTTAVQAGLHPVEESTDFWITDFFVANGTVDHHRQTFQLSALWRPGDNSVLDRMDEASNKYRARRKGSIGQGEERFRWIHLPSNNRVWAKKVLETARTRLDNIARPLSETQATQRYTANDVQANQFYTDEFFQDCSNSNDKLHFHARCMKPHCKRWQGGPGNTGGVSRSEVVFMMPYLHWEWYLSYMEMRHLVKWVEDRELKATEAPSVSGSVSGYDRTQGPRAAAFVKNLKTNTIQIRQSLDQSLYWTLQDTTARDQDQVIDRYTRDYLNKGKKDHEKKARPILMVDQLWLWMLNDENRTNSSSLDPTDTIEANY